MAARALFNSSTKACQVRTAAIAFSVRFFYGLTPICFLASASCCFIFKLYCYRKMFVCTIAELIIFHSLVMSISFLFRKFPGFNDQSMEKSFYAETLELMTKTRASQSFSPYNQQCNLLPAPWGIRQLPKVVKPRTSRLQKSVDSWATRPGPLLQKKTSNFGSES